MENKIETNNLDYGYTNIQNTWSGSKPEDMMWLPSGSTAWVKDWFYNLFVKH